MANRPPDDPGFRVLIDRADWSQWVRGLPILFLLAVIAYVVWQALYAVAEYEQAVVLRFGRYHSTQGPGLHFKVPLIDHAVMVDMSEHSMRLPWSAGSPANQAFSRRGRLSPQEESMILTGDLYAGVVEWTVIWRVVEPKDYLFSIQDNQVQQTITAIARSTMNRVVGDYSADEILTTKREEVGLAALAEMHKSLAAYECGVYIDDLQMQRVTPPERVKPAFDEVNASIQTRDQLVNEANQERNKLIPLAEAESDRLVREAEGYAARRQAETAGEITALLAKFQAYQEAPEVTRQRLYLDAMEQIFSGGGPKIILDAHLPGLLPLLDLGQGGAATGAKRAAGAVRAEKVRRLNEAGGRFGPPTTGRENER